MSLASKDVDILNIGYGSKMLAVDNSERARLVACAEEMHSLHTVLLASPNEISHEGKLTFYGVGGSLRIINLIKSCILAFRIAKKIGSESLVVSTQDPFETGMVGFVVSRFYGKRLVVQEHGDFFSSPHWPRESFMNRIRYYIGLFLLRRAWRVRVVAERIKKTLIQKGVPAERIFVLPVVTDTAHFRTAIADEKVRSQFPPESVILLSAARFVQQKNISLLLHSFMDVSKNNPHAQLLLVGSGPLESDIRSEILHHNLSRKVVLMPWTESFPSLLKCADVYLLSSNYEGWGRVLVESMAAGVPVVTTDVGCVGEVFHNKVHGLVVPIGERRQFTLALKTLVNDASLRKEYGERARLDSMGFDTLQNGYTARWADIWTP